MLRRARNFSLFTGLITLLGAGVPALSQSTPASCTGLCLQQVSCASSSDTTSISGTIYAPNGTDPLPNVLVYVPNGPVEAFPSEVGVMLAGQTPSGSPLVSTYTKADGTFTLSNMPVGSNIPLVIQAGRWRRQVTIPTVASCVNTVGSWRLPQNRAEGDIPRIAIATGSVDAVECVLRKIGVNDSEFGNPSSESRIHLYTGSGAPGAQINFSTPSETQLWDTLDNLKKYDMVLFPCQGDNYAKSAAALQNIVDYANAGGRIFTTHYSYIWLHNNAPFSSMVNWNLGQDVPNNQDAIVDTSFPKGSQLATWLSATNASTVPGLLPLKALRKDVSSLNAPTQSWLTLTSDSTNMQFSFNAPVNSSPDQQVGRIFFNDYHVEDANAYGNTFPSECATGAITAQEKLLEYTLFDLSNPVSPDAAPQLEISWQNSPTKLVTGANNVIVDVRQGYATNSTLSLALTLPSGITATSLRGTNDGSGWSCLLGALTCTRTTGGLENIGNDSIAMSIQVASSLEATNPMISATASADLVGTTTASKNFPVQTNPVISWATPAAITYGTALSGAQLNASSSTPGTYSYDPAPGSVLDAGTHTLQVTFTPDDSDSYASVTKTVQLTINAAPAAIIWSTPSAITYGAPLSNAELNASSATAGTYAYTPAAGTVLNVGTQTLSVTFTPSNTNYSPTSKTVQLVVNAATPTVTWDAPSAIAYGSPLTSTQLNASSSIPGTFVYSPPLGTMLNTGTQPLNVTFTPADANYAPTNKFVNLVVTPAPATVTWNTPSDIAYGSPLTSAQLNASSSTPGAYTYSPALGTVLNAGTQTLSVTFTPSSTNYSPISKTVELVITPATPTINWPTPSSITYRSPLNGAQLDASSSTPGTYIYTPPLGTILNAGIQTLSVTFTSADANYSSATKTVDLVINPAVPVILWPNPSSILYGAPLTSTQLNASSEIQGSYVYTPALGTVLNAGTQTLSATFIPSSPNYSKVTQTTTLVVGKAPVSVSLQANTARAFVQSNVTFTAQISSTAGVPAGNVTFMDGAYTLGSSTIDSSGKASLTTATLSSGVHAITAVFAGSANYLDSSSTPVAETLQDFGFTINGASIKELSSTVSTDGMATYTLQITPLNGSSFIGDITLALTGLPAGATYTITPQAIASGGAATTVTVTVTLPAQSVSVASSQNSGRRWPLPVAFALLLPVIGFSGARRSRTKIVLFMFGSSVLLTMSMTACCGGGYAAGSKSRTSTYPLKLTASAGALQRSITLDLKIQ